MSDTSHGQGNVRLVEEAESFRHRWETIQSGFVDEPRRSVEEADALVSDVIRSLSDAFTKERRNLEEQWKTEGEVSTDDLRQGLQRYRSFFTRLLSQGGPDVAPAGKQGERPSADRETTTEAPRGEPLPAPEPQMTEKEAPETPPRPAQK
jgi:hypothetical protein